MATTITAGNSTNGAAISSDNTGILELKTGTGSGTTAITVNASQNVGIGTATPRAETHVFGLGQTTANLTDAGNRGGMLRVSDDNAAAGSGGTILFANSQADVANSVGFAAIKGLLVDGSNNTSGDLAFSTRTASTNTALTEQARITTAGLFQFNSGYGSVATAYGCRAWVNFNGTAAGTFAGGVSTVTRIAGSTTATVTTTTAHGLLTGSVVYALTGVAAGTYTVTLISATQFSFTTVATTALTAASITFAVSSIRSSGNVSSVADNAVGNYTVNFTIAMPDINYSAVGSANCIGGSAIMVSTNSNGAFQPQAPTTTACQLQTTSYTANQDCAWVSLAFFR